MFDLPWIRWGVECWLICAAAFLEMADRAVPLIEDCDNRFFGES